MYNALHKKYLSIAYKLAKENPDGGVSVGCVIVKGGKIISKGYRITKIIFKNPLIDITYHAEHIALLRAGIKAKGATLYVTLEPCAKRCCYQGDNTVCCSDLIIEAGIKTVVYCESDNGLGKGGEEKLINAGIKVIKL